MLDNISRQEVDNSSSTPETAESDQSKDTAAPHMPQDSVQNTYSAYALAPQSQGGQIPLQETSEYQAREALIWTMLFIIYLPFISTWFDHSDPPCLHPDVLGA